jgi:hypothetical protein
MGSLCEVGLGRSKDFNVEIKFSQMCMTEQST